MNAYTREEEEQLERLKKWWTEYRVPIIAGLVIGFGLLFGSRAWFAYQNKIAASASAEYEQLRTELTQQNNNAVMERGDYIVETYPSTPYAALAALAIARLEVEQDSFEDARGRFQWVIDNADQPELVHVARLRLARVLIADGRAEQALTLVEHVEPGAFAASYAEVRGDVYAELGRVGQAREAYREALEGLGTGAGSQLVRMKLEDLG